MNTLATLTIRLRVPILLISMIATTLLATRLPSLQPDDDVMQFLPANDPDIKLFRRVNSRFGGLDVAIVGLEADTMFGAKPLEQIRTMTRRLAQIDGVFDVLSFTELPDPQPAPDGLRITPLVMDRIPTGKTELAALKQRVLSNKNAVGNLISKDGRAAMVLCFLGGNRPPIHIAADIRRVAKNSWTNTGIYFGGSPFIRLHLAGGTKTDLRRLTPIVALVVLLITLAVFRHPLGVALALGSVGVAIVWLLGGMAATGARLTLVGSSLPTILMAIGGAYGIHLLTAYYNGVGNTINDRIHHMLQEMGPPVIASAATTSAGFLSFWAMDIAPLRTFGLQAAAGVLITATLALLAIPAILSFTKNLPRKRVRELLPVKPLGHLGGFCARHPKRTLTTAVVIALLCLGGLNKIAPDATLSSFFAEDSEPGLANQFLERHFGGSSYLQVFFKGDLRNPFVLAQLQKVVEVSRAMPGVEQVSAITDALIMMGEAMGGRADLPVNHRRVAALYPFLEGTAAIDQMISPTKDAALVQIRLAAGSGQQVATVIKRLQQFIDKEIPSGILPVQMRPFAVPSEGEMAYTLVAKNGATAPTKRHITTPKNKKELALRQRTLASQVAKRVVRLAHDPTPDAPTPARVAKLTKLLQQAAFERSQPIANDLLAAVKDAVQEHLGVNYGFINLDELSSMRRATRTAQANQDTPLVSEKEKDEWENRVSLMVTALGPLANQFLGEAKVKALLNQVLPATCARDPEGLKLTAAALAGGLEQQRTRVLSHRIAAKALANLGIKQPTEELLTQVTFAITDLFMPVAGFADMSPAADTVLARVTGSPVINVALCNSTIRNQLKSLAVAMVILLVIMSMLFRSISSAIKGLVPSIFMLTLAIGAMGLLHIPIDLTTSMIAAIALGIGVDYAIHFLWRRRRRGEPLAQTVMGVGPSIISNALQVAGGFAVLCLSEMVPMQRFGALVAMTMVLAAISTFILLPALRAEGRVEAMAAEPAGLKTGKSES